jgi:hypothetical protein
VGKREGKRSIGKSKCRWVDNIKVDFKLLGWGLVGWIILMWDMDKCWGSRECGKECVGCIKCGEFVEWLWN